MTQILESIRNIEMSWLCLILVLNCNIVFFSVLHMYCSIVYIYAYVLLCFILRAHYVLYNITILYCLLPMYCI